jgi:hypothetical protein
VGGADAEMVHAPCAAQADLAEGIHVVVAGTVVRLAGLTGWRGFDGGAIGLRRGGAVKRAMGPDLVVDAGEGVELDLGIETLRKWVRQDEATRGERDDRLTSKETEELKRLRKENADLKRTNEILRLASAFFAQEADPTRRRS